MASELPEFVDVNDVMRTLKVSRYTAYMHLRRARGAAPGTRGMSRCEVGAWRAYLEASGWIEDALFCGGSLEHAAANFSSRARTPKQLKTVRGRDLDNLSLRAQGKASTGRTFYLGSMVELCVYEKDKPKDLASEVARETLQRDCGWDGEARLVRWEVRCTRAWFREQEMVVHGVPVRGDRLSFADFLEGLPMLAKTILGRFRHTEMDPERPGLRRTFASWHVAAGVSFATLAPVMGHTTTTMLQLVYGRISAAEIADKMRRELGEP